MFIKRCLSCWNCSEILGTQKPLSCGVEVILQLSVLLLSKSHQMYPYIYKTDIYIYDIPNWHPIGIRAAIWHPVLFLAQQPNSFWRGVCDSPSFNTYHSGSACSQWIRTLEMYCRPLASSYIVHCPIFRIVQSVLHPGRPVHSITGNPCSRVYDHMVTKAHWSVWKY